MGAPKKGASRVSEDPEELARVKLQAILLADSFATTFRPITLERPKIHGDFVLVNGDTVSNMSLTQAIQEHKDRRKKDTNAVMTMVVKRSKPSMITHQSRLGTDELFMLINPETKQLLYYEDKADKSKAYVYLDKLLLSENTLLSLHNDLQGCL